MTDAEKKLWKHLRLKQLESYRFRRQFPLGEYIVDFICLEKKLIIEVDGGQHSDLSDYETERNQWLEKQNFQILRFWNNQVLNEIESVVEIILNILTPHLYPPPQGGRKLPRKQYV